MQQDAVECLKKCLLSAPVLSFPDFDQEFILTTDASAIAVGAILTQKPGKREVLIGCASRMLNDAELRYPDTDRELLAVYYGVSQFCSYLWGHPFVIQTDHIAIPYLSRQRQSDSRRAIAWFMKLNEYEYRVEYKKGVVLTSLNFKQSC